VDGFMEPRQPEHTDGLPEFDGRYQGHLMGINIGGFKSVVRDKFSAGFVPLSPGLNVCYGLNGAGKTRFLDAVSQLASGEHGSSEGACWTFSDELFEAVVGSREVQRDEAGDVRCRMATMWPKRHNHEEAAAVDEVSIAGENAEILREFATFGGVLSTWPLESDSRAQRVIVPICAADAVGPVTAMVRSRMDALWKKYTRALHDLDTKFAAEGTADDDASLDAIHQLAYKAAQAWEAEFGDSILFNDRNFGVALSAWDYESWLEAWETPEALPDFLDPKNPLYLPAVGRIPGDHWGSESPWRVRSFGCRVSTELRDVQLSQVEERTRRNLEHAWTGWYLSGDSPSHSFPGEMSLPYGEVKKLEAESPHFRQPPAEVHDVADRTAREWSERASKLLSSVLPGSPELTCVSGNAVDWLRGDGPKWLLGGRPLEDASKAQLRWVSLVIGAVTDGPSDVLLIDEPESGLHRTAERAVSSALSTVGFADVVIAATHSPLLIDEPGAHLLRISAEQGAVSWKDEYYDQHLELGILKSDVLANVRLFLLVEGEHEKVVFDVLFGSRLRALGVRIIAMRGGAAVSGIIDSQFLFTCTDATIMVLLDNVSAESVQLTWGAARAHAQRGELEGAREEVLQWSRQDPAMKGRSDERAWLSELMTAALSSGEHERVEVHGLAEPDLIYYVPSESFVGNRPWSVVKEKYSQYVAECAEKGKKPLSLKPWIEKTYSRDATSPEAFRSAAACMDRGVLPSDITELMQHLEKVVGER